MYNTILNSHRKNFFYDKKKPYLVVMENFVQFAFYMLNYFCENLVLKIVVLLLLTKYFIMHI